MSGRLTRTANCSMRLRSKCSALSILMILFIAAPAFSQSSEQRIYIVQLSEPSVLTYRGREGGPPATRPAGNEAFDPQAAHVRSYAQSLLDQHDRILHEIGAWQDKVYSYRYTFNGFAARLTESQVQKLRAHKEVIRIWQDRLRYLQTNASPTFLGLYDSGTGLVSGLGLKGEDVVIGVIDSGIHPEHPSFADSVESERPSLCRSSWADSSILGLWLCQRFKNRDDILVYDPPVGWNGTCETGESFTVNECNNKLIGARFYVDGFQQTYPAMDSNEFMSARDADGHGTHIASTAAGSEVRAVLSERNLDRIVGMAPRARIAAYKACWLQPGDTRGSCSTSDLQRAIEDAVADGVDIINYSIGNDEDNITDPDDLALLAAANAGVLAVVAAGNDGPFDGTILSPAGAPWVLTVGAATRTGDRFDDLLRIDAPEDLAGDITVKEAAFTPTLLSNGAVTGTLVLVDDGDTTGGTTYDGCTALVNGSELEGNIAFLQRGGPIDCTFEVKVRNAEDAGAIAVVVFNNNGEFIIMGGTRGSVNIPAVMTGLADGEAILATLQNDETVEVTLDKSLTLVIPESGNVLADFTSRGPNLTAPDILKPDVIAPGVNILAGQTPNVANGIRDELFQYLSGTSMSTPMVAGLAALLKEANPDWSPAAIKSALVTTARQDIVKEDGVTPADPFDMGGGHVVPNSAVDPGLVYDADKADYEAFLCGLGTSTLGGPVDDRTCNQLIADGYSTEASDLNLPSIAVSSLVSDRTVTRRVTNTGAAGQYTVAVEAPPGIDVTVNPSTLTLGSGETGSYAVTLSRVSAAPRAWVYGALNWSGPSQSVRSPLAIRPDLFAAPFDVVGTGATGSLSFDVEFGYTGAYSATFTGLSAPVIFAATVADDQGATYEQVPLDGTLPASIWRTPRNAIVTTSTDTFMRFALFDENTSGDDDLDLYVYYCPTPDSCDAPLFSGRFDSNERIDIRLPKIGEYLVDVHGFDTEAATSDFELYVWTVGEDQTNGNPNLTAPSQAIDDTTSSINLSWSGLATQDGSLDLKAHLGTVTHDDQDPSTVLPLEITVIEIQTP